MRYNRISVFTGLGCLLLGGGRTDWQKSDATQLAFMDQYRWLHSLEACARLGT